MNNQSIMNNVRIRSQPILFAAPANALMLATLACLASAVVLLGQPVSDSDAIEELRKREPSGANDQKTVDDFLAGEIAALIAADDAAAATQTFRDTLRRLRDAPDSSDGFKGFLAERFTRIAKAELDKKQGTPVQAANAIVRALSDLNDKRAAPALLAALAHPSAETRFLAARRLRKIRDVLDPTERTTVIRRLRDAGVQEADGIVVERVYAALAFPDPPPEAIDAILAVLQARVDRYRNGSFLPDEAESALLEYLGQIQLSAPQAAKLVQQLAPLLRLDVERYARGTILPDEADAIARRVEMCESMLERVTGLKAGKVRQKMQRGGPGAVADMRLELIEWVGSPQEDGALAQNPWNVPRGAP